MHRTSRIALAALALPLLLGAQAPPGGFHMVINNTNVPLSCSFKEAGAAWRPWFDMPPGANWQHPVSGAALYFQCKPPVKQRIYSLLPGTRYSLLHSRAGTIRLVEVTAPHP